MSESSDNKQGQDNARILGHLYAEELYREADSIEFRSGIETKEVKEDLAIKYRLCSPDSSLLLLYTIEQFMDNNVLPPLGHPVYNDAKVVGARALLLAESKNKQGGKTEKRGHRRSQNR